MLSPQPPPLSPQQQQLLVPYCGRAVAVPRDDPQRLQCVERLQAVEALLAAKASGSAVGSGLWAGLHDTVAQLSEAYGSESCAPRRFQLELLREAILPYIQDKMLGPRFYVDKARFIQLQQLLFHLSAVAPPPSDQHHPSPPPETHAAVALLAVDQVVSEIRRERSLWPSELAHALELAALRQWTPILHDHRQLLHSVGGKALLLGLVEVIGRPVLMLYPVCLLGAECLRLAQKLGLAEALLQPQPQPQQAQAQAQARGNNSRGGGGRAPWWTQISTADALSLLRLLAMVIVVNQALAVLAAYSGLGYACLGLGLGALALASNDELLKRYIPVIAPHAVALGALVEQAGRIEAATLGGLLGRWTSQQGLVLGDGARPAFAFPSATAAAVSGSGSGTASMPTSSRVELLPSPSSSPQRPSAASPAFASVAQSPADFAAAEAEAEALPEAVPVDDDSSQDPHAANAATSPDAATGLRQRWGRSL